MSIFSSSDPQLSLRPLGAGDLIDRAVRFYRKNFWTFVLIASPPVIFGTLVSVSWTMAGRNIFSVGSSRDPLELTFYYIFLWVGTILIWLAETITTLVVMGGASRNFVRHLLFEEPITFRETYKNIWKRTIGLVVSSTILTFLLGFMAFIIFYAAILAAALAITLVYAALSLLPPVAAIVSVLVSFVVLCAGLFLFFLLASRFAYIPQVMLVEGQGVFSAIARSTSLASGNVKRFSALFIFTTVAAYSALAILYIPVAWYAWLTGVDIFAFDSEIVPAWYEISKQLISQASFILLSPVWMVGLCLLYVDDRVRHEGYDIELMAARRLGEIPAVPETYVNPLQPALAANAVSSAAPAPPRGKSDSILGLK